MRAQLVGGCFDGGCAGAGLAGGSVRRRRVRPRSRFAAVRRLVPRAIATGNFNDNTDGSADLAIAGSHGSVRIELVNGNGGFRGVRLADHRPARRRPDDRFAFLAGANRTIAWATMGSLGVDFGARRAFEVAKRISRHHDFAATPGSWISGCSFYRGAGKQDVFCGISRMTRFGGPG